MRKHLYKGKRIDNGEWVEGYFVETTSPDYRALIVTDMSVDTDGSANISDILSWQIYEVAPNTVSKYAGEQDKNGKRIFEGNIVRFCGIVGEVVFEKGAFGIGTHETIDYNLIEKEMKTINSHNFPEFCGNDNFISLWEIWWNFEIEDEQLDVVEIIGNKWDNPELLEG